MASEMDPIRTDTIIKTKHNTTVCNGKSLFHGMWWHIIDPLEVNLAYNKTSWQGTTERDYHAYRGNDGNYSPHLGSHGCAKTLEGHYMWWGVDLEQTYSIQRVIVFTPTHAK